MDSDSQHNGTAMLRLDGADCIRSADDAIVRLQIAAGGTADGRIAIPQIAAVARLARRLNILISRPLLIGVKGRIFACGSGRSRPGTVWSCASPNGRKHRISTTRTARRSARRRLRWRPTGQSGAQTRGCASSSAVRSWISRRAETSF